MTPEHVIRQKWHETGWNLRVGDIVLIHDKSEIKGKYKMGIVEAVKTGEDGQVRSGTVGYMVPRSKDQFGQYSGGKRIQVSRSIQRLTLLLPIEEQNYPLEVVENTIKKVSQSDM